MEVILLKDMDKLGNRGEIVKVADGYGRNYLLPQKMAVEATPQGRKWVDQQRVRFLKEEAKEKVDAQDLAKLMQDVSLTFTRKSGEHGTLFGSVTAMDVAEGLAARGFKIDRRKIQLENPIKALGESDVPVKLHREVTTNIKVKVEPEGGAAAAPAPVAAAPKEQAPPTVEPKPPAAE
ncbi:MAG TPA: 50S ribosomal protein L9 [Terriglobia bacterium]|nr:50S ribosomal protein L9 [Terriglobia bacterium]